jgi:hypothetical protein
LSRGGLQEGGAEPLLYRGVKTSEWIGPSGHPRIVARIPAEASSLPVRPGDPVARISPRPGTPPRCTRALTFQPALRARAGLPASEVVRAGIAPAPEERLVFGSRHGVLGLWSRPEIGPEKASRADGSLSRSESLHTLS